MRISWLGTLSAALVLGGCAARIPGPSVMVLPGNGKSFEQFQVDDAVCRRWAEQQCGVTVEQAAADEVAGGAVAGTVVGAAAGAALGAAAGDPASGAAAGAGVGLLGGSAVGSGRAAEAGWTVQHRYDMAYIQSMYAKGNQVPVTGHRQSSPPRGYPETLPPVTRHPLGVPPPPPGVPPPPPPGPVRP